jgi:hypothetical protein
MQFEIWTLINLNETLNHFQNNIGSCYVCEYNKSIKRNTQMKKNVLGIYY